jgi:hypothetical protein
MSRWVFRAATFWNHWMLRCTSSVSTVWTWRIVSLNSSNVHLTSSYPITRVVVSRESPPSPHGDVSLVLSLGKQTTQFEELRSKIAINFQDKYCGVVLYPNFLFYYLPPPYNYNFIYIFQKFWVSYINKCRKVGLVWLDGCIAIEASAGIYESTWLGVQDYPRIHIAVYDMYIYNYQTYSNIPPQSQREHHRWWD